MRNAMVGKPAGMAGVTLIALFAIVTLGFLASAGTLDAAIVKGSVKVTVVDVTGAEPSNVTLTIKKVGSISRSAKATGTTITFTASPATYVITSSSSKYKTWGGDCSLTGEVVIVANTQANCTLSNASPTPTPPPPTGDGGSDTPSLPSSRTEGRTR